MKKMRRIGCMLVIFSMCFCACGQNSDIYLEKYEKNTQESETLELGTETKEAETSAVCYVYICGAVKQPGVYALPEGSRVFEVIEQAGGFAEDAEEMLVNLAETVTDGMMLRIYTQDEAEEMETDALDDGKVNINTADVTELMTLPGVGSSKAEAIVAYREEHGDFSSIEGLMNIPGIKEGIFNQLKEHIKVNN